MKQGKVVKTDDEAKNLFYKKEINTPYGFVQWKGTDVCCDLYCKCGEHFHIDDYFMYYVKCPECGTVYACNPNIELIEIEEPLGKELQNVIKTEEKNSDVITIEIKNDPEMDKIISDNFLDLV